MRTSGRKPTLRDTIVFLLAFVLGGTGGISLHPYVTPDNDVGIEVKMGTSKKKPPPKPQISDDCYWIIDGRDYKRSIDAYPCMYRAATPSQRD